MDQYRGPSLKQLCLNRKTYFATLLGKQNMKIESVFGYMDTWHVRNEVWQKDD